MSNNNKFSVSNCIQRLLFIIIIIILFIAQMKRSLKKNNFFFHFGHSFIYLMKIENDVSPHVRSHFNRSIIKTPMSNSFNCNEIRSRCNSKHPNSPTTTINIHFLWWQPQLRKCSNILILVSRSDGSAECFEFCIFLCLHIIFFSFLCSLLFV